MKTIIILICIVVSNILMYYIQKNDNLNNVNKEIPKNNSINQVSYQKYAKFHDQVVPTDQAFDEKMNKICNLIVIDKKTDIKEIAKLSGCSYEECILKIRYLKIKRQIGTCHINHKKGKILPCTPEEYQLVEKYQPYIYYNQLSISEIACRMPGVTTENIEETKEKIYKEIHSLYESDLLSGIKINEVDKEIIYYNSENKEKDYITIRCGNCGALNDVNRGSKVRCKYCDTIIEDKVRM